MKKKSLITMLVALTLVAVVGVGATLAYLSSTTETLTNTFTVGSGISIKQDETDIDAEPTPDNPNPRTEEGNNYEDIHPGDVLVKDPTVTVFKDSSNCYVFMKLTGADELATADFSFQYNTGEIDEDGNAIFDDGINPAWEKVPGEGTLDGLYKYVGSKVDEKNGYVAKSSNDDVVLESLFDQVTYSSDVKTLPTEKLADVLIQSCAVQADNLSVEEAITEVGKAIAEANKATTVQE